MSDLERIVPGSWIAVGRERPIDAVVCSIRPRRVEVVYIGEQGKAFHREVHWKRDHWDFADKDAQPKQADKDERLVPYVKTLRTHL